MAYQSWSVVFGEQPSAAKWNILGTNDASFNDGTGIANLSHSVTAVALPYKFLAYHNTTQSLATGATVAFNTELYDTNNNFASNTYTAPVDGFYKFFWQEYDQGVAGSFHTALTVGGSEVLSGSIVDNTGQAPVDSTSIGSALIQLTATNAVTIKHNHGGGGSLTCYGQASAPRYTFFGGYLVSRT